MEGSEKRFAVTKGVPQRSVLGLLLWNIAYDSILDASWVSRNGVCR